MNQKTIGLSGSITGRGLHTGNPVTLRVQPAGADQGIYFVRTDLDPPNVVPALYSCVRDTHRATTLECQDVSVRTVEHLLAAAYAAGITNLRVELTAEELPFGDGSAQAFDALFRRCRIVTQNAPRGFRCVAETIRVERDGAAICISPSRELVVTYHFYVKPGVAESWSLAVTPESFSKEIAAARSFCMADELPALQEAGLIRGISETAGFAVARTDEEIERLAALFDPLDYRRAVHRLPRYTVISETPPRFDNEIVRHKILDILGDMALGGAWLLGHIEASGSGHRENIELLERIGQAELSLMT